MSAVRASIFASAPLTSRGSGVHLDTDPKGESILYTNGKSVFIRNIENPSIATEYTQHSHNATVAKYAPSGYYIASGDERGNVRVWDTASGQQILKLETQAFNGRVNDIAWDGESKRIIAVGDGKAKYAHGFMFDTGSTCGTLMGHSKMVNSVAIRQKRPFTIVTGGDDTSIVFSKGFPLNFQKTIQEHSKYVQEVKFSPNGDLFASVGSDGKIFLYNAADGEKIKEVSTGDHGHSGTIFAMSWSDDNKSILTSSGDRTAKIWDVETSSVVNTFDFTNTNPPALGQQVGNIWRGNHLLSLSLSGDLNYLDPSSSTVTRVVKGHQKSISTAALSEDRKTLFTGDNEGRVLSWDPNSGVATPLDDAKHSNQVTQVTVGGTQLASVGIDDVLRISNASAAGDVVAIPTSGQPKGVSASDGQTVVVATEKDIQIFQDGKKVDSLGVEYRATAIAINRQGTLVAIGSEDKKVYVMKLDGTKLSLVHTLSDNSSTITTLAFNPDGDLVAAGDGAGKIMLYDATSGSTVTHHWVFHTARVQSIGWSPNGRYAVSGSLDTHVYVWSRESPSKRIAILNAHQLGVSGTVFLDDETVVSTGSDACVKTWKLTHH
ncbi:quinon protein alcohol dehydrogenase-like superfamily [Mortierella sp. GBAus27b]|nr:quinon protein alcohol dehydrogenase-like superfamily [Mortierella sp. GBAus27b]